MTRPRHAAPRRRGHYPGRGAELACALICAAQGLRYVLPSSVIPVDTPGALVYLAGVIPLTAWGWAWIAAATLCLAAPYIPASPDTRALRHRAPRLAAIALTTAWASAYAAWWIVALIPNGLGNPEAWRTAAVYLGLAYLITLSMLPDRRPP